MNALSRVIFLALIFSLAVVSYGTAEEKFVLRPKYPQVKPIETEELVKAYDRAVIVDVRSEIEYDVVHIQKALHIPVALGTFVTEIEKIRPKKESAPLVFYCNGYDCAKSYKAAIQAMEEGFSSVYCYDAGIFNWVKAHPEKSSLMGKTPAEKEKLIPIEALKSRKIGWSEFRRKADQPNAIVIDIREPFQRAKDPELPQNKMPLVPNLRNIPSDRLVSLLKAREFQDKELLITDAVGKQVQWLQYYLAEYGYTNYSFLENGVLSAAEAGAVK